MIKKRSLLANSVCALYALIDTKFRQGYFYVEYSDGHVHESYETLNEAIKRYDEVTMKLRGRALAALEEINKLKATDFPQSVVGFHARERSRNK